MSEEMTPITPENEKSAKRHRPRAGKHTRFLTQAAMIAAIYAALTYACAILTQGMFRVGEAMMILPFFTPSAIPGLFIGYFIGYFLTGSLWDAIFGSIGALVAATLTYLIGRYLRRYRFARVLACIPPIVMTALIMPFILMYVYGRAEVYFLLLFMCVSGETVTCLGAGLVFFHFLERYKKHLFFEYK